MNHTQLPESGQPELPEFANIAGRILGTPEFSEMVGAKYIAKRIQEFEKARGNALKMATLMRELSAMMFVLKTCVFSSEKQRKEVELLVREGKGFEAYQICQLDSGKSESVVEQATIFIEAIPDENNIVDFISKTRDRIPTI